MAQNNTRSSNDLLEKTVNLEPTGVIYNINGSAIEEFVEDYLAKKGITGVDAAKIRVKREGSNSPEVAMYVFFDANSKYVRSAASNVPANLRSKMESSNVYPSEELSKVLAGMCGQKIEFGRRDGRTCHAKLNIFRVIGMMLAADPSRHQINIIDVRKTYQDRDAIMSIVKQYRYNGGNNADTGNRYLRMIDDLEDRR